MKKNKVSLLWFFALPYGIPLGLLILLIINIVINYLNKYIRYKVYIPLPSAILITLSPVILFTIFNTYQYLFKDETEFNLIKRSKKDNTDNSKDKLKAMYKDPSLKFVSNKPDGYTVAYNPRSKKYYRLVTSDKRNILSTIVNGSAGSGKSISLLNQLIYNFNFAPPEEQMNYFVLDVKPELAIKSVDITRDDIMILDPSNTKAAGYDIFYKLRNNPNEDLVMEQMDLIARALIPVNPEAKNQFFTKSAQNIFVSFLAYGFFKEMTFIQIILKTLNLSMNEFIEQILNDKELISKHPRVIGNLKAYSDKSDVEAIQDIEMSISENLRIFNDSSALRYQLQDNPVKASPEFLLKGSIFLCLPDHLLNQYKTIFSLITEQVINYLSSLDEAERSQDDAKIIHLLLDEAGSIKFDLIQDAMARLRSRKVMITLGIQSFSQLSKSSMYGVEGSREIIDLSENIVILSSHDKQSAEMIASWIPQYRETRVSTSSKSGLFENYGSTNESVSFEYRQTINTADLMKLRENKEVLVFSEGDYFLAKKIGYYQIPQFLERSDQLVKKNLGKRI